MRNPLFEESEIFIFADGSKENAGADEIAKINDVRKLFEQLKENKKVSPRFSDKNLGLTTSIVSGITEIVNQFGKIIVIEDDLELSPGFLKYMNDALNVYENEERVMHIGGYMVPHKKNLPETFFLRAPTIWGWGTWKRAWGKFEIDAAVLLEKLEKDFGKAFSFKLDVNGTYNYTKQLKDIASGKLDTWDIQWAASVYLHNGLCLHPSNSLSRNNGFDGSGVHCGYVEVFNKQNITSNISVYREPFLFNKKGTKAFSQHFRKNYHPKMKDLVKRNFYKCLSYLPSELKNSLKKVINTVKN